VNRSPAGTITAHADRPILRAAADERRTSAGRVRRLFAHWRRQRLLRTAIRFQVRRRADRRLFDSPKTTSMCLITATDLPDSGRQLLSRQLCYEVRHRGRTQDPAQRASPALPAVGQGRQGGDETGKVGPGFAAGERRGTPGDEAALVRPATPIFPFRAQEGGLVCAGRRHLSPHPGPGRLTHRTGPRSQVCTAPPLAVNLPDHRQGHGLTWGLTVQCQEVLTLPAATGRQ
jgi:hypothetical protein